MRIIQITDSHISRDTPQRTLDLEACIANVNSVRPAADLVVHTGDVSHEGLAEEFVTARARLDKLSAPYVVMPGNKDKRKVLNDVFPDNRNFQRPGGNNSVNTSGDSKFIQFSVEEFPFRLIFLDTVGVASKGEFCKRRQDDLNAMLAADVSRPVVIFMHHAPFEVLEIPDPRQFEHWSEVEALWQIIGRYDQVQSIYCGHIHRNVETMVGGLPVKVLTCTACDLRKGKISSEERQRPMVNIIDLPC